MKTINFITFKQLNFLFLLFLILNIICCKKEINNESIKVTQATLQDLTNMLNVQQGAAVRFENVWKSTNDTMKAVYEMSKWLLRQNNVKNVYIHVDYNIGIEYKSGLWSSINLTMMNQDGLHKTRSNDYSSYKKGSIQHFVFGPNTAQNDKIIKNNKVLIFSPYTSQFYGSTYSFLNLFAQSKTQLEVTLVQDSEADFDVFKTISEYGLIMLNTHGTSYGTIQMYTGIEAFDIPSKPDSTNFTLEEIQSYANTSNNEMVNLILNKKLELSTNLLLDLFNPTNPIKTSIKLEVTDEYVSEMSNKMKEAVVFGNFCYSGNTKVIEYEDGKTSGQFPSAFLNAGAISFYGYAHSDGMSRQVDNEFCLKVEKSFINRLVIDGDSTGVSHLNEKGELQYYKTRRRLPITKEGEVLDTSIEILSSSETGRMVMAPFYLYHFHNPNYQYGCGVLKDSRDGEIYKLACIGNQVWMAENLRFNAPGSLAYNNDESKVKRWGRLYNYSTLSNNAGVGQDPTLPGFKGICPNGYHIPSNYDWQKLISNLDPNINKAMQLKSNSTDWENEEDEINDPNRNISGFSLLPSGSANILTNENNRLFFYDGNLASTLWTASLMDGFKPANYPNAAGAIMFQSNNIVYANIILGSNLNLAPYIFHSCRCVKDE